MELVPVELVIFLLRDLALGPLPDGHHGVQGLHLGVGLILRLVLRGVLLLPGLGDLHTDGEADIVGILPHQLLELPVFQELAVLLILRVGLDVHDDVGAHGFLFTFRDGVAVGPGGLPFEPALGPVLPGHHGDLVRNHEGGIKAHAELADDVGVLGVVSQLLLELIGAGGGNDAQVVFQVRLVHTDAVVGNRQGPGVLVHGDLNFEIPPVHPHGAVGEGLVAELVTGVAGVGDDFPEENLLVGINGVDHQVQEPLGFRFELFFRHDLDALPSFHFLTTLKYSTAHVENK